MKKQIFKRYMQDQAMLLPPSLEELIAETHIVREVNRMIGEIDQKILEKQYKGGGTDRGVSNPHTREKRNADFRNDDT